MSMENTLHLLRCYFSFVPLQRWLNALAMLLIMGGALCVFINREIILGFLIFGVVVLVLVPALAGGVAMRFGSTRSMLYLRPDGRTQMLLAATLMVTLIALLLTLPFAVDEWLDLERPGVRQIHPGQVFPVAWTGMAIVWISLFVVSRSAPTLGLIGLLPILGMTVARVVAPYALHPAWHLVPGIIAWLVFVRWYLRTPSVTRPALILSNSGMDNSVPTPLQRLFEAMIPDGETSRSQLQQLYLLGATSSGFGITGVWVAFIFVLAHQFVLWMNSSPGRSAQVSLQMLNMLPFLCFLLVSMGHVLVRRTRCLWLRERMDRSALFGMAEKHGLRSCFTAWGIVAALVLAITLLRDPGSARFAVLFVIAHAAFALCAFYGGMAMTQGWVARNVVLMTILGIWFLVHMHQLEPKRNASPETAIMFTIAALLLAAALRWYAYSAWKRLDWRIAKLPWPAARSSV